MSRRRAIITGMDMLSSLGLDAPNSWEGILAGRNGIAPIEYMDLFTYSTRFGGLVKGFNAKEYLPAKEARELDLFIQHGLATSFQAVRDFGLEVTDVNRECIGVSMGSGIGDLISIENNCRSLFEQGPRHISPFSVPGSITNMVSGLLSIRLGLQGPNYVLITACTTGTHSISMVVRNVAYSEVDVMVTDGSEMATCGLSLGGLGAARALSTRSDEPTRASRPWDQDRDGLVLSDGSGALVPEELEHARACDVRICVELVGFGTSGGVFHMIAPSEDGASTARCMKNAPHDAGLDPHQADYINAHGASTPAGDITEIAAVESVLGEHAHALLMSSTKPMTDHLLGAAGTVEVIFSMLALRDQVALPAINLDNPDEDCDLDLAAHEARPRKIDVALSNSFSFGGTNGTLVFRGFAN